MRAVKRIVYVLTICLLLIPAIERVRAQDAQLPDQEPVPPAAAARPPAAAADARSSLRSKMTPAARSGTRPAASEAGSNLRTISPTSADLNADTAASVIEPSGAGSAGSDGEKSTALKFDNTASDIVLMAYAEQTGKTLLIAPDVPKANITLRSQPNVALSAEEYVEAIEVVLSMNGILLEPFGDKFVKVLARKTIRSDGIEILMEPPEGGHPEKTRTVSQMIQLLHITIDEAKTAIEGFKKADGMIQTFERTNSLLVTDTQENVNRMLEIIKFIDQPIPVTEQVFERSINFAKAEDIKTRLEEIVAQSQEQQSAKTEVKAKSSGSPGTTRKTTTPTSISERLAALRNRGRPEQKPEPATPNEVIDAMISDADRGMIRGKVQIIADERTNKLIIITRQENMNFFDDIINVFDIETTPDIKVEVLRLEYADAEEVSAMLNDLIGNSTSKKDDADTKSATRGDGSSAAKTLAEAAADRQRKTAEAAAAPGVSKLGQLSKDNIKILADKRTNAIVMMGSIGDLAAIMEIIRSMDIMLSQVLIETVVLEVALKDELETGINWVRRINDDDKFRYTVGGGGTSKGGTSTLFGSQEVEEEVESVTEDGEKITETVTKTIDDLSGTYLESMSNPINGLEYFMTLKNLRLDAVVQAAQSDSRSRVLSSPILLTVDNKEATIEATELRYMYKGMRYMGYSSNQGGGSYEPDIEQRDVGLTVKVTPRINPNGNVILTIEETFEDVGVAQPIDGQDWPTITTRKLSADVSVGNGETVILGGLVKGAKSDSEAGIPLLKDIPYIGKHLFGSTKRSTVRSELLVFLTPYVIDNPEDMRREARRRKDYLDATDVWTKGWSDSDLADPVPVDEMKTRLERKKQIEKRWKDYAAELEEAQFVDKRISLEREKALQMLHGDNPSTNAVPPSAGVMKVEEITDDSASETPPEDEVPDPQRPQLEEPKKSWWKRLFSSSQDG
jgi:general secretion pathway protein D